MDVSRELFDVFIAINQNCFESALKKVTLSFMLLVEIGGIADIEPLYG